ncbi:MAG: hypothetical protein BWY72_02044 [Bacteroidetes bacterium ADurb.Bin416]|nr:MAG: hypothetical protein BWY72_02044 [Bacteroidetes bacterium ADurb.Bin416]
MGRQQGCLEEGLAFGFEGVVAGNDNILNEVFDGRLVFGVVMVFENGAAEGVEAFGQSVVVDEKLGGFAGVQVLRHK